MNKQDALELAQQAVIEVIKAGAISPTSHPNTRNGEDIASFIIAAHQKLMAYYEKSDLQTQ